jgi:hypothetical protein
MTAVGGTKGIVRFVSRSSAAALLPRAASAGILTALFPMTRT